ncbi:MAG: Hsp33 family molecular chaperone HslO [Acetivibrionales bacterium]|jgi:molecular chaperone Hsp33
MKDYIIRATAADTTVRAFAAVTSRMAEDARKIHKLSPIASAALGRTLTAASMMSRQLKGEKDTITIQIKGEGPMGGIVVVTDSEANVRGYVYNPDVYLPLNDKGKLDISGAIGKNGYLNVIKDMGLKEPYIGYVQLVSGEIAEDLAYYFANSEQVPSVVALGVLIGKDGSVSNSGGYIIQLMPGAEDGIIDFLEKKINSLPPVTALLSEAKSPEQILDLILGEKGLKIVEKIPTRFVCNCSRERMERNLISLGRQELIEILDDQGKAEVQCHFCNTKYHFAKVDLQRLIGQLS